jgi:TolB-like protein/DNA-binding winged helix-turn-helix (wHTH) protein/Tfp pilus assembly protein PilF
MAKAEKHLYEFGPYRLDSVERLLIRGEETIPLTPKAIDTLLVLVANSGRVLERDELMKSVWPDTFVEDGALARNISALRKALGDDNEDFRYIETIPKRGYRFVAPVKDLSASPPPTSSDKTEGNRRKRIWRVAWVVLAVVLILAGPLAYLWFHRMFPRYGAPSISSLAVLPLDNPSNDPAQEYFADGMTEELINSLAKIEALKVISRTSAMTYKGVKNKPLPVIARELNVDAVVEGSVLQSGNRVRITVQLFEGKTDRQLWAQSYEENLRDVLSLQGEVASAIAREIRVQLTPVEKQRLTKARPVDPEAYLAYSYGRYWWNKRAPEDIQKGIEYFQRAIAKDPSYAPAYAGLADAYALLGSIGSDVLPPNEVMPKAKKAALEAVRLDDNLAEGHTSLAYVKLSYDWDLTAAEREFKRAINLNPGYATAHHWYAHYFLASSQPEKALAEVRRAVVLDPLSLSINVGLGWCLYHAHRYDEAIQQYRSTLDISPNFSLAHSTLGMAYVQKRLYNEALAEFNKASTLPGSHTLARANIGRTYALTGRAAEARQVLRELERSARQEYVPAMYVAAIYASLGASDQSMSWIEKAYEERSDYMIYLSTEPSLDGLRSDPRFQEFLKLIGPGR